jgi:hypothetical protein
MPEQINYFAAKIVYFFENSKFPQNKPPHDSLTLGFAAYMSAASLKNNAADKQS